MGADLGSAPSELAHDWLKRAGAADGPELKRIQAAVAKLANGAVKVRAKVENPRMFWTVQDLGEAWTKGDLAKEFPDQIHRRRSERDDEIRLKRHVYPVVGAVRVRDLTVEECEQVMRSLAPTLAVNTRRNVGLTLGRILTLAVYPLKIISASPFPKGLLPSAGKGKGKALADYRPADDARLMACASVPLHYRLLWGFLAREGMRSSEAIQLRWGDVDLKGGSVVLDENKSDDPRSWPLDPGVVRALRAFKPKGAEPKDLVFVEENGGEHNRHALAKTPRELARGGPRGGAAGEALRALKDAASGSGARPTGRLRDNGAGQRQDGNVGGGPDRAQVAQHDQALHTSGAHGGGLEARRLEAARRRARAEATRLAPEKVREVGRQRRPRHQAELVEAERHRRQ